MPFMHPYGNDLTEIREMSSCYRVASNDLIKE